ncbi:MAG: DUF1841 family protein [Gammaproteobacteria bacterium]|nr:DUF1841 family protein [Gammaproteobacteria bacterium]MDH4254939.1 DUF1841 family protein [Gammaproteobacteria bacterium]MDH5308838.1 DUF1841 family protein [Gammaproteobacteria bacterium]
MIFGQDRAELRRMYRDAWLRHRRRELLGPLEAQIAAVVEQHPEYHSFIEAGDEAAEFSPDEGRTNPFLHMGLHLAVREQVSTDRPVGIRALHATLLARIGDPHETEHRVAEVLAEALWEAQARNAMPDERLYLDRLQKLAGRGR